MDSFSNVLARSANLGHLDLHLRATCHDLPCLFPLRFPWTYLIGTIQLTTTASDFDATRYLNRVAFANRVMVELIWVRIRIADARATSNTDSDPYCSMRTTIALDVLHDQISAVFRGRHFDLEVCKVSAMLQDIVTRPGMNLAEIVVGPLRQCNFFRRLYAPHLDANIAYIFKFGLRQNLRHAFHRLDRRRLTERDFLIAETTLRNTVEPPFKQVNRGAADHLSLVWIAAICVREVEIVVAVSEPPAAHRLEVETRIVPMDSKLICWNETGKRSLGGRVKETGKVDDVPAIRDQDAIEATLCELFLQEFHSCLMPF